MLQTCRCRLKESRKTIPPDKFVCVCVCVCVSVCVCVYACACSVMSLPEAKLAAPCGGGSFTVSAKVSSAIMTCLLNPALNTSLYVFNI